jgi:hypothetical protein
MISHKLGHPLAMSTPVRVRVICHRRVEQADGERLTGIKLDLDFGLVQRRRYLTGE